MPDVQKLQYLKGVRRGEPEELIRNFADDLRTLTKQGCQCTHGTEQSGAASGPVARLDRVPSL